MRSLEPLVGHASSVPDQCTTYAHWRKMLGDQLSIFEHFLLCTDELGSHIPKPDCDYTWFRIEDEGDDAISVIDEERGDFWRQPKRDGLAYELNWRLIYRMLCGESGINFGYRKLDGFRSIYRIGTDRPAVGFEIPVYHHRGQPSVGLADLLMATEGPLVFIHSGVAPLSESFAAMLRHRGCFELTMLHNFAMDDRGVVVLAESAAKRLHDFRAQHGPATKVSETEAAFDLSGSISWSRVHFKFLDQHTVRASVGSRNRTFHYSQLAMANSRNAEPTKQWHVLKSYAEADGFINWKSRGSSANLKKQTQELNKKLRNAIGIEGVPIEYDSDAGGYRTVFSIEDV